MKIKYTQQSLFDMRYNRLVVNSIKKSKLSYLTLKMKYDLLLLLAMGIQSRYRPIPQQHIYLKSAEEQSQEDVVPRIILECTNDLKAQGDRNLPGAPTQTLVLRHRLVQLDPVAGFNLQNSAVVRSYCFSMEVQSSSPDTQCHLLPIYQSVSHRLQRMGS